MSQADSLRHIADVMDKMYEQLDAQLTDIANFRAQLAEVETQRDMEHCECDIALARIAELERERNEPCDDPACNLAEMTVRNELAAARARVAELEAQVNTLAKMVAEARAETTDSRVAELEAALRTILAAHGHSLMMGPVVCDCDICEHSRAALAGKETP